MRTYAFENIFAFSRLTALNPSINISASKIRNIYNNEGVANTAEAEDFKELAHRFRLVAAIEICPICNHPKSYFEVHAENY